MSIKSCIKNIDSYNIYSYKQFLPYSDKSFSFELKHLLSGSINDYFFEAVDMLNSLYRKYLFLNRYDYIVSVPYDNNNFYELNKKVAKELSKLIGIEYVDDFFVKYSIQEVDIRDRYFNKDYPQLSLEIDLKYVNKKVLFIDMYCSSGKIIEYLFRRCDLFTIKSDVLNYAIRFDSEKLIGSAIKSKEVLHSPITSKKNSGYIVKINKLFNKRDIVIDLRDDISIMIGENGIGKSTAYKIAMLALDRSYASNIELLKYPYESIEIYIGKNEMQKINTYYYFDFLFLRQTLINLIYSSFFSKFLGLFGLQSFNLLEGKTIVKLIEKITDNEYKNLLKKIYTKDLTYRYDLNDLLIKYNIYIDQKIISDYFLTLINVCFSLTNVNSFFVGKKGLYYNLSNSKYLSEFIPSRFISFDKDSGNNLKINRANIGYVSKSNNKEKFDDALDEFYRQREIEKENEYKTFDKFAFDYEDPDGYNPYEDYEDPTEFISDEYFDDYYDDFDEEDDDIIIKESNSWGNSVPITTSLGSFPYDKCDMRIFNEYISEFYNVLFKNKKYNENFFDPTTKRISHEILEDEHNYLLFGLCEENLESYEYKDRIKNYFNTKVDMRYLLHFDEEFIDLNKIVKSLNSKLVDDFDFFKYYNYPSNFIPAFYDEKLSINSQNERIINYIFHERVNDFNFGLFEMMTESDKDFLKNVY